MKRVYEWEIQEGVGGKNEKKRETERGGKIIIYYIYPLNIAIAFSCHSFFFFFFF